MAKQEPKIVRLARELLRRNAELGQAELHVFYAERAFSEVKSAFIQARNSADLVFYNASKIIADYEAKCRKAEDRQPRRANTRTVISGKDGSR